MCSRIVPAMVNGLNWKVTYRISLMPQLIAFEFWYDDFVAIDFVWLGRWRVSWLVGIWNQLGIVSATVNLNWADISCLFCICDSWISSAYDFSSIAVATRLCAIGLCNPHEIISATVNLNSIVLSRNFAFAISAPKSVWYFARRLRGMKCRKRVIHVIQYAKPIWHCKRDNSVKAYARVRPLRKEYQ